MTRIALGLLLVLPAAGLAAGEPGDGGLGTVGRPPADAGRPKEPLESAVLFVNGRAITRSHIDLKVAGYRRDNPRASEQALRHTALWSILMGEMLRAEAETIVRLGMTVPEQEVERRWRQMLKEAGGPAELARQEGKSVAALKELARDDYLAEAYRHTLRQQLARPTPEELREYYRVNQGVFHRPESVEARAVVVRRFLYDDPDGRAPRAGAERRAREVLDQLAAGADFAKLVARYSEDAASAANGGKLGDPRKGHRIERGAYELAVEKALFSAEPGSPAVLVEGRANYYVLQVLKRSAAGVAPFEEIENEVLLSCTRDRIRKAEEKFFREAFDKMLILDPSGRRLTAKDFLAAPTAPPRRSLFEREEPAPEPPDRPDPSDPAKPAPAPEPGRRLF